MEQVLFVSALFALVAASFSLGFSNHSFPNDFSLGTATASYQIEGAWNEDGRTESIWDYVAHKDPTKISNNASGDIACDSYHKYKEDIAMVASMNLTHYRFSISWSRILPSGFNNKINTMGILYYQNILEELEKYKITPIVTIYHWDLPQSLQDLGGWVNPKIVDYFTDYAEVLFESFPTVKFWITVNEPKQVCVGGFADGSKAPFFTESGTANYLCTYHVVKAHASAYRLYQKNYKTLGGKLTMAMDGAWNFPKDSNNTDDVDAAERRRLFEFGIYAHPIFFGDWPEVVSKRVEERSLKENFTESRLPSFTEADKANLKGTADFMALNYYDTQMVANAEEASYTECSYKNDMKVVQSTNSDWTKDLHGVNVVPDGFRQFLKWLKKTYNNPEIIITENGFSDDGTLKDYPRCDYLANFLSVVLESINEDGVNITKYTYWSLMDNFEWTYGYNHHFGLHYVDFNDPERKRTPKTSMNYYKQIAVERKIVNPPNGAHVNVLNTILISSGVAITIIKYLHLF